MRLPIGTPFVGAFTLSLSLSRKSRRLITLDDFSQKPASVRVEYPFLKNTEQDGVVDAVEEFPHIALKRIAWLCTVLTHRTKRSCQIFHALVRTLADSARKRGWDKSRLKNWIEDFKYCVMQDPVTHGRFVYAPQFRIVNHEHPVWSMTILFSAQFATEFKNFVLNIFLKRFDIRSVSLVTFENVPGLEQIFCRGYSLI